MILTLGSRSPLIQERYHRFFKVGTWCFFPFPPPPPPLRSSQLTIKHSTQPPSLWPKYRGCDTRSRKSRNYPWDRYAYSHAAMDGFVHLHESTGEYCYFLTFLFFIEVNRKGEGKEEMLSNDNFWCLMNLPHDLWSNYFPYIESRWIKMRSTIRKNEPTYLI